MPQIGDSIMLERIRQIFDPQQGWQTEYSWHGTERACKTKQSEYASSRIHAEVTHDGPHWRCIATYADVPRTGGEDEVPVDTWTIDTEWVQNSVWENPNVLLNAGTHTVLAQWREEIGRALKKNPPALDSQTPSGKVVMFNMLARGIEAYEVKRIVLSRRRTVTVGYAGQFVCDPIETVWSTARLAVVFSIPPAIYNRLPATPANAPAGFKWSWKQRRASSDFTLRSNKVEEVFDFVFAAWSENLYVYDG